DHCVEHEDVPRLVSLWARPLRSRPRSGSRSIVRLLDLSKARSPHPSSGGRQVSPPHVPDDLTLYQWHTRTAEDYFCPTCGILPFRRPRVRTTEEAASGAAPFSGWSVNVRCLEGVDLDSIPIKRVFGSRLP